jgi:heme/copper-type cytochrome/quinol oxidase subunit 2
MKRSTVIKKAQRWVMAICTIVIIGLTPLGVQAQTSLANVEQARMEISNTTRLIEQKILLSLTAGLVLLGIILVCYLFNENNQSKSSHQTKRNQFLTLILLVIGVGLFCNSCGSTQQFGAIQAHARQQVEQSRCPYHPANQKPADVVYSYRTIGYPTQPTSYCKFCGKRLLNTLE